MMTFIKILIVAIWKSRQVSGHTGGEICHFKLLNYLYLTIMWWERTQFSIHLQLDFVSLEMNYEPLVWEHQSPKYFGGEPTIPCHLLDVSHQAPCSILHESLSPTGYIKPNSLLHPARITLIKEVKSRRTQLWTYMDCLKPLNPDNEHPTAQMPF